MITLNDCPTDMLAVLTLSCPRGTAVTLTGFVYCMPPPLGSTYSSTSNSPGSWAPLAFTSLNRVMLGIFLPSSRTPPSAARWPLPPPVRRSPCRSPVYGSLLSGVQRPGARHHQEAKHDTSRRQMTPDPTPPETRQRARDVLQ